MSLRCFSNSREWDVNASRSICLTMSRTVAAAKVELGGGASVVLRVLRVVAILFFLQV